MNMRIVTDAEYKRLVELTQGDDAKIHWDRMFSWVNDPEIMGRTMLRCGFVTPLDFQYNSASDRDKFVGFRPAIDGLISDPRFSKIKEGESAVIGTLYMKGKPIKNPQKPNWEGDIPFYILDSSLEMREALPDPAYQVTGIRVGVAFVADRCLLKNISYEDIERATGNYEGILRNLLKKSIIATCNNARLEPSVGANLWHKYLSAADDSPLMLQEAGGAIEDIICEAMTCADGYPGIGELESMAPADFVALVVERAVESFDNTIEDWKNKKKS